MTRILYVSNPIQAALFNFVIIPEMKNRGGKWSSKHQERLVGEWKDVEAVVADNDHVVGRTFPAQKTNWNIVDSGWINTNTVSRKLRRIASRIAERDVPKQEIVQELQKLKNTFSEAAPIDDAA